MIRLILREMTPWLSAGNVRTRDRDHESFIGVNMTNAWNDHGGNAHYVLVVEPLARPEHP